MAVVNRDMNNGVTAVEVICERCHKTFENLLLCYKSSKKRICDKCQYDKALAQNRATYSTRRNYFKEYRRKNKKSIKAYQEIYRKSYREVKKLMLRPVGL